MKLEIGVYVEFKINEIRVIDYITHSLGSQICFKKNGWWFIENVEPTRTSHNIIDLIEVGDYVDGLPVLDKSHNRLTILSEYKQGGYIKFLSSEIKDVVTKEQFNSMKFEVK